MKKQQKVNEKKYKQKLPTEVRSSLETLLIIAVTLGITIPIHLKYPDKFSACWVIAICVAIIIPTTLTNGKIYVESKGNYNEEQKKIATKNLGKAFLSIWYADFTFVCMFMNWTIAFFIFAGIYLIKMIYNVSIVLLNRIDSNKYPIFLIIGDFVLSFLLLILLLYKIPNESLQTIVISLTAALIGGFLTLLGVIMTIKKSDKDRKEEEIKKAKPVFAFNMLDHDPKFDDAIGKVCLSDTSEEFDISCDVFVELENSNLSPFELKRVFHDGKWVILEGNTTVLPSSKCILSFKFENDPTRLFLEVEDSLSNKYYYKLFILTLKADFSRGRVFHTVREIKNITKDDMEKLMKEESNNA